MLGASILTQLLKNVLETKFPRKVYHSAFLFTTPQGNIKPAVPVEGKYVYVGIDDQKEFYCYCRQTGPMEVVQVENVTSCSKRYQTSTAHRLVFINMQERRGHDDVLSLLLNAVIKTPKIRLSKVITNHEQLLKDEQPSGKFSFKMDTFYAAIDFFVLLPVQTENCTTEIKCEGIINPFC